MTTRVLVADDEALIRGSFRLLVDSAPGLSAVAEAATGEEAVAISRRERPDVVLMDVRMPVMDGIEATRHICAAQPEVRVLIVTTFDLDEYVYGALRAGAAGFLLKDTPPPDLLRAIQVIAGGDALLAPTVTQRLIERYVAHVPPSKLEITEREREVLVLIARGLSNHEIGAALHLSLGTVKTHVGHLLTKLGARTRVHLVIAAYEAGLVP
ncbi:response regulator transcription factor [Nonomuraea sp. LPB2021202275-12-8]|uniref:response regulator transcription factor n=1 Tax=Nonomuraea sp. LPB2021202275-12-8 TaxID=3120159 RepID=UPI00300D9FFE